MKYKRQSLIVKIIQEQPIKTHEQLVELLENEGMRVTQATVSRDIKELGLIKTSASGGGSVYAMPTSIKVQSKNTMNSMNDAITEISCAMNIVVIKTYPGMASGVCAFLDEKFKSDFLGSIAGDDTIFIAAHDIEKAEIFIKKLRGFLK